MAPTQVDAEYQKEIEKARGYLRDLISRENCAPQMLHLALHDAGAYDPKNKITIGPNGSTRMEPIDERLKKAVDLCEKLKEKENYKKITYADLYQLAGVVAVEVTTKGPTIGFSPGRMDSTKYQEVERLIPHSDIDAQQLRNILIHIGVNAREFVALFGGLYGLVSQAQRPGTDGLKFDNSFFKYLVEKYTPKPKTLAPTPQEDAQMPPSSDQDAVKDYPAENALMTDKDFGEIVELYAENEDRFLADYAAAHKKVSELGFTPTTQGGTTGTAESAPSSNKSGSWNRVRLAQGAIGIALATTVVILGYFLSRRGK